MHQELSKQLLVAESTQYSSCHSTFGSQILLYLRGKHEPQLGYISLISFSLLYSPCGVKQPITATLITKPAASNHVDLFAGLRRIGPTPRSTGQREKKKRSERAPWPQQKSQQMWGETGERVTVCTADMYSLLLLLMRYLFVNDTILPFFFIVLQAACHEKCM